MRKILPVLRKVTKNLILQCVDCNQCRKGKPQGWQMGKPKFSNPIIISKKKEKARCSIDFVLTASC